MLWAENVTHMWEKKGASKGLMEKTGGKRQFGECKYRWKDNVNMYVFKEKNGVVEQVAVSFDGDKWRDVVNTKMYLIFLRLREGC